MLCSLGLAGAPFLPGLFLGAERSVKRKSLTCLAQSGAGERTWPLMLPLRPDDNGKTSMRYVQSCNRRRKRSSGSLGVMMWCRKMRDALDCMRLQTYCEAPTHLANAPSCITHIQLVQTSTPPGLVSLSIRRSTGRPQAPKYLPPRRARLEVRRTRAATMARLYHPVIRDVCLRGPRR